MQLCVPLTGKRQKTFSLYLRSMSPGSNTRYRMCQYTAPYHSGAQARRSNQHLKGFWLSGSRDHAASDSSLIESQSLAHMKHALAAASRKSANVAWCVQFLRRDFSTPSMLDSKARRQARQSLLGLAIVVDDFLAPLYRHNLYLKERRRQSLVRARTIQQLLMPERAFVTSSVERTSFFLPHVNNLHQLQNQPRAMGCLASAVQTLPTLAAQRDQPHVSQPK